MIKGILIALKLGEDLQGDVINEAKGKYQFKRDNIKEFIDTCKKIARDGH